MKQANPNLLTDSFLAPPDNIGVKLKELREADGLKLAVVAKAVGTTVAHLSAIETTRIANPGYQLVYALAKFYGVTVEQLVENTTTNKTDNRSEQLARRLTSSEDRVAATYLKFLIAERAHS